jgi:hypothetical protein
MPLLIDGFNLIYKFPELEEFMHRRMLPQAMKGLLDILKEYREIKKTHIRVVFDGKKELASNIKREKSGLIDVYYSLDYSADFLIKEFIKKDPNPKMTTVVTSDNDILFYVNRFRAKTITSEKFAEHLIKTIEQKFEDKIPEKEENPALSEDELSFWEKLFKKK